MNSQTDVITNEFCERYAKAVYDLGRQTDSISILDADMAVLRELLDVSSDVKHVLESPIYKSTDKLAVLCCLAEKLNLSHITLQFLRVIAKNRRLNHLGEIITAYKTLSSSGKGLRSAHVSSAQKLTPLQEEELVAALNSALGCRVELKTNVDTSLIAGLVVKIGSKMFDSSLKSKLEGLRKSMKET